MSIIKWALVALLVAVLAVVGINSFDEPLSPEAQAALRPPLPIPQQQNGYYAMLGFFAPAGTDMITRGIEIAQKYADASAPGSAADSKTSTQSIEDTLAFRGDATLLCFPLKSGCLALALKNSDAVSRLLAQNKTLIDRYYSLATYPYFQETTMPMLFGPLNVSVTALAYPHALILAKISREFAVEDTTAAVEALARDLQFWRTLLSQKENLLTKLIVIGTIRQDATLLSEFIRAKPIKSLPGILLQPLTVAERDFSYSLDAELRSEAQMFNKTNSDIKTDHRNFRALRGYFDTLFFKNNATLNTAFVYYHDLAQSGELSGKDYENAKRRIEDKDQHFLGPRLIYNPIGKILVAISVPGYLGEVDKIRDLDGLLRLAQLQFLIKQQGINDGAIPQFLQNADKPLANPYTSQPMAWDSRTRHLFFPIPGSSGRMEIAL